jgi:S-adenosylmethionine hydrolase
MAPPVITLLTDFGAGSGYPAQMKAVILRAAPEAVVVDISHEVAAYDVLGGALLLEACVPWFDERVVHCAVIDPGVGTARLPLVVVDESGRRFVGPDNGLLTPFLGPGTSAFEIGRPPGAPPMRSATFHGRDLFAPVAAWLAQGGDPARLGPPVEAPLRLAWPQAKRDGDRVHGECLIADRFGNVITSIRETDLGTALAPRGVEVGGRPARFVKTFGEGSPGELVAMIGSSGRLQICLREGDAAHTHGIGRGERVVVTLPPAGSP